MLVIPVTRELGGENVDKEGEVLLTVSPKRLAMLFRNPMILEERGPRDGEEVVEIDSGSGEVDAVRRGWPELLEPR